MRSRVAGSWGQHNGTRPIDPPGTWHVRVARGRTTRRSAAARASGRSLGANSPAAPPSRASSPPLVRSASHPQQLSSIAYRLASDHTTSRRCSRHYNAAACPQDSNALALAVSGTYGCVRQPARQRQSLAPLPSPPKFRGYGVVRGVVDGSVPRVKRVKRRLHWIGPHATKCWEPRKPSQGQRVSSVTIGAALACLPHAPAVKTALATRRTRRRSRAAIARRWRCCRPRPEKGKPIGVAMRSGIAATRAARVSRVRAEGDATI